MGKYSLVFISLLVAFASCKKSESKQDITISSDKEMSVTPDSTIYGVATDDFGMSTFAISFGDSSLSLSRTMNNGNDALIYGGMIPGDSFAITIADGGESLARSVNLTQLREHTIDFKIENAGVLLKNTNGEYEKVEIVSLDSDSLVVKFPSSENTIVRR